MTNIYIFKKQILADPSIDEIVDILLKLPTDVTMLDFSHCDLQLHGNNGLSRIFTAIPKHVSILSLNHTMLWIADYQNQQVIDPDILRFIPKTITSLLLDQVLASYHGAGIFRKPDDFSLYIRILKSLENIQILSFDDNYLQALSCNELGFFFKSLPQSLTEFNLQIRSRGVHFEIHHAPAFKHLPCHLKTLTMQGYSEYGIDSKVSPAILHNLPKTLKKLAICSAASSASAETIIFFLSALPTTVEDVDLSYNWIGNRFPFPIVIKILRAIPSTISTINLSNNSLFTSRHIKIDPDTLFGTGTSSSRSTRKKDKIIRTLCNMNDETTRHRKIELSKNGESDYKRAVIAFSSLYKQDGCAFPLLIFKRILSYLTPHHKELENVDGHGDKVEVVKQFLNVGKRR